jgi:hypothetical protein
MTKVSAGPLDSGSTFFVFGSTNTCRLTDSIKSAARTVADGMLKYYHGNESGQPIGMLPDPYYWWEAGAMWGTVCYICLVSIYT